VSDEKKPGKEIGAEEMELGRRILEALHAGGRITEITMRMGQGRSWNTCHALAKHAFVERGGAADTFSMKLFATKAERAAAPAETSETKELSVEERRGRRKKEPKPEGVYA